MGRMFLRGVEVDCFVHIISFNAVSQSNIQLANMFIYKFDPLGAAASATMKQKTS